MRNKEEKLAKFGQKLPIYLFTVMRNKNFDSFMNTTAAHTNIGGYLH